MSLTQQLTEFRFNLETLDLLNNMGKTSEYSTQMLGELGLTQQLIKFMQTNRMLLNSVLLRLQLYSEQNLNEQKIRSSLSILNNPSVGTLLDYLYKSTTVTSIKEVKKTVSPPPTPVQVQQEPEVEEQEEQEEQEDEVAEESDAEESHFDSFFSSCVRQSDDASHTVKMSAMYDTFSKWWSNNYEDETPTKDELKEYLSERLGHTIKSIVSNVSLA
jgi:ribosomal protein L12E/L44/L45/RPP1/RPP2